MLSLIKNIDKDTLSRERLINLAAILILQAPSDEVWVEFFKMAFAFDDSEEFKVQIHNYFMIPDTNKAQRLPTALYWMQNMPASSILISQLIKHGILNQDRLLTQWEKPMQVGLSTLEEMQQAEFRTPLEVINFLAPLPVILSCANLFKDSDRVPASTFKKAIKSALINRNWNAYTDRSIKPYFIENIVAAIEEVAQTNHGISETDIEVAASKMWSVAHPIQKAFSSLKQDHDDSSLRWGMVDYILKLPSYSVEATREAILKYSVSFDDVKSRILISGQDALEKLQQFIDIFDPIEPGLSLESCVKTASPGELTQLLGLATNSAEEYSPERIDIIQRHLEECKRRFGITKDQVLPAINENCGYILPVLISIFDITPSEVFETIRSNCSSCDIQALFDYLGMVAGASTFRQSFFKAQDQVDDTNGISYKTRRYRWISIWLNTKTADASFKHPCGSQQPKLYARIRQNKGDC